MESKVSTANTQYQESNNQSIRRSNMSIPFEKCSGAHHEGAPENTNRPLPTDEPCANNGESAVEGRAESQLPWRVRAKAAHNTGNTRSRNGKAKDSERKHATAPSSYDAAWGTGSFCDRRAGSHVAVLPAYAVMPPTVQLVQVNSDWMLGILGEVALQEALRMAQGTTTRTAAQTKDLWQSRADLDVECADMRRQVWEQRRALESQEKNTRRLRDEMKECHRLEISKMQESCDNDKRNMELQHKAEMEGLTRAYEEEVARYLQEMAEENDRLQSALDEALGADQEWQAVSGAEDE